MASDVWRDFADILVNRYDLSVILVDQRGHGDSPRAESYQVTDFVADLVENLPTGLDFLMGQSLGGVSCAWAAQDLQPKRYIGLDPAFNAGTLTALALRFLGRMQTKLPDRILKAIGMPPEGAAPDMLERVHIMWSKWDSSMMGQLVSSGRRTPFPIGPPAVPSTLVLADPSLFVKPPMATELAALGWDIRTKPKGEHDLHVQDPAGVIAMLDDVLRPAIPSPTA
jgi:pimeloyl-ACP methyl ester carboxylesterase